MKKGFTLIEIVMALVIIGLISAIIIPKYASHKENAAARVTFFGLKSIIDAIELFHIDNRFLPSHSSMRQLYEGEKYKIYLRKIPQNTFCGDNSNSVSTKTAAAGDGGWYVSFRRNKKETKYTVGINCKNLEKERFQTIIGKYEITALFEGRVSIGENEL